MHLHKLTFAAHRPAAVRSCLLRPPTQQCFAASPAPRLPPAAGWAGQDQHAGPAEAQAGGQEQSQGKGKGPGKGRMNSRRGRRYLCRLQPSLAMTCVAFFCSPAFVGVALVSSMHVTAAGDCVALQQLAAGEALVRHCPHQQWKGFNCPEDIHCFLIIAHSLSCKPANFI